jgi:hypothetical protein
MEGEKKEAETAAVVEEKKVLSGEEREDYFAEGVDSLFLLWQALDVMKEAMVAGGDTLYAIEDMRDGIIEQFQFVPKPKAKVSQNDLEDMIYDFCSNDLYTVLDDGSAEQIADHSFALYRKLCNNDLTDVLKLREAAERKRLKKGGPKRNVIIERKEESYSESSEGEEEEGGEEEGDNNSNNNNNNNNDNNDTTNEEEVKNEGGEDDEGGWEVVGKPAKKGNKSKKKK